MNRKGSPKLLSLILCISLILGLVVHLTGFLIFRIRTVSLPSREDSGAFVEYVSAQSMNGASELEEQAMLFDSAPLFIPTRWNAAQDVYVVGNRQISGEFHDFEPEIDLMVSLELEKFLLADNTQIREPVDLLASRYWEFFKDFGYSHDAIVPFSDPQSVATVRVAGEMRMELHPQLKGDAFSDVLEPVIYYLGMAPSGRTLGGPALARSSGNQSFDRAVSDWLTIPSVLAQLPSGYLEIKVYP